MIAADTSMCVQGLVSIAVCFHETTELVRTASVIVFIWYFHISDVQHATQGHCLSQLLKPNRTLFSFLHVFEAGIIVTRTCSSNTRWWAVLVVSFAGQSAQYITEWEAYHEFTQEFMHHCYRKLY